MGNHGEIARSAPGYQTVLATSATSSSFSRCTSSVVRLAPASVEENPHCVETPSRSSPNYTLPGRPGSG